MWTFHREKLARRMSTLHESDATDTVVGDRIKISKKDLKMIRKFWGDGTADVLKETPIMDWPLISRF